MRRNCNLELRLLPSGFPPSDHHRRNIVEEINESPENHHHQQQQQPLTIFFNGRVCVCDVTELQARAILALASREMDERMKTPTGSGSGSEPASPALQSQIYSPSPALSMKRSLQRFLQKRKNRIQATSPYH